MNTKIKSDGQKNESFIESARRAQIVQCAIEVIATMGYVQASVAQIAKKAGISKGVVTYHFRSKDEIMQQIVSDLYEAGDSFVKPYLKAESTAAGTLRAYIKSNLEFMKAYQQHVIAVTEIVTSARTNEGKPLINPNTDSILEFLVQLLLRGSKDGEFREFSKFSARVMATMIRFAIDGISFLLKSDPDIDLAAIADELIKTFYLATRNE